MTDQHECYFVELRASPAAERLVAFVHPLSGNGVCYRTIARSMRSEARFAAFQSNGFGNGRRPSRSVVEMAGWYAACLAHHASEPVVLGGWSLGAVVALEMARLGVLDVAGPVFLVDPPTFEEDPPEERLDLLRQFESLRADVAALSDATQAAGAGALRAQIGRQLDEISLPRGLLDLEPVDLLDYFERQIAHYRARLAYRPAPYGGDAVLMLCDETRAKPEHQSIVRHWRQVVERRFVVEPVPGAHATLVDDPDAVAAIAAALDATCGARRAGPAYGGVR